MYKEIFILIYADLFYKGIYSIEICVIMNIN